MEWVEGLHATAIRNSTRRHHVWKPLRERVCWYNGWFRTTNRGTYCSLERDFKFVLKRGVTTKLKVTKEQGVQSSSGLIPAQTTDVWIKVMIIKNFLRINSWGRWIKALEMKVIFRTTPRIRGLTTLKKLKPFLYFKSDCGVVKEWRTYTCSFPPLLVWKTVGFYFFLFIYYFFDKVKHTLQQAKYCGWKCLLYMTIWDDEQRLALFQSCFLGWSDWLLWFHNESESQLQNEEWRWKNKRCYHGICLMEIKNIFALSHVEVLLQFYFKIIFSLRTRWMSRQG